LAASWPFTRTQAERDPRGYREPVLSDGSSRLEKIDSLRRSAWRGASRQAQMREDSHDHRRILDGGMILRLPPQFEHQVGWVKPTKKAGVGQLSPTARTFPCISGGWIPPIGGFHPPYALLGV
jgi:hypothetical protein